MDISRWCELRDVNWALMPDLLARLTRQGWAVKRSLVEIDRYPDTLNFDSIDEAMTNVRMAGAPRGYTLNVYGASKSFHLTRGVNIHHQEYLSVGMRNIGEACELDGVMEFLGLVQEKVTYLAPDAPRTAFLAHKFDRSGNEAADKLARFLELLGFAVKTGRGYTPGSIAEKVRSRIESQANLFVILTPGEDNTWLIQESLIAEIKEKSLFVLKEQTAQFKPGILADREFIPFEDANIEATFIPILEGLRDLGYLDFDDESS